MSGAGDGKVPESFFWDRVIPRFNNTATALKTVAFIVAAVAVIVGASNPAEIGTFLRSLATSTLPDGSGYVVPVTAVPAHPTAYPAVPSKAATSLFVVLAPNSAGGSQPLLDGVRDDLAGRGFRLAATKGDADLICEVSGAVRGDGNGPGAIVGASLALRWRSAPEAVFARSVPGNGIGSTPERAATRAYRNAASDLSESLDAFFQAGASNP